MATAIKDYINCVADSATRDALYALLTAINTDLGVLYANTDTVDANLDNIETALEGDSIVNECTLSTGSTAENVATTAFQYRIDGVTYAKAAVTAGTAMTAATINTGTAAGDYMGGFLVQINAAGTISTLPSGTDQVHTTTAAALAAAQALTPTAGNVAVGYVVVTANTDSAWTAGTDDLTAASDCAAVAYTSASELSITATTAATSKTLSA